MVKINRMGWNGYERSASLFGSVAARLQLGYVYYGVVWCVAPTTTTNERALAASRCCDCCC